MINCINNFVELWHETFKPIPDIFMSPEIFGREVYRSFKNRQLGLHYLACAYITANKLAHEENLDNEQIERMVLNAIESNGVWK